MSNYSTPIRPGTLARASTIARQIAKTSPEAADSYMAKAWLRVAIEDEAYRVWTGIERKDAA